MTRTTLELIFDLAFGLLMLAVTVYVMVCVSGCAYPSNAVLRDSVRAQYIACFRHSRGGVLGEFRCWQEAQADCKALRLEKDCGDVR